MRISILFILLFSTMTSVSQNCDLRLSGKVYDLHDGSELAGATVIISETDNMVYTDLEGSYSMSGLCPGTYNIQVSHPLCRTRVFRVKVLQNTERNFRLEHHIEELNLVTILGRTYKTPSQTLQDKSISRETLERYSSGSLGDALNELSGVSSLNTGSTVVKPVIHGLHSSRVTIINNGARMEDQEWGAEHAPSVDINSVKNIRLVKAAGALQYSGDAVGGIIVAEPGKIPVKDSLYGKTILSAATNGQGGSVTSEVTKSLNSGWYGHLQGTLKRFGDFESADYTLSNTGILERSGSLRVGLNRFSYGLEASFSLFKNEIGILRASLVGSSQDQVRAINNDQPLVVRNFTYYIDAPKQDVTHYMAQIKAFRDFNNLGKLRLQYDFQRNQRFEFDLRRGADVDKASLDLELDTHQLWLDLETRPVDELELKTGITGKYQNNTANPATGVRRLIPDFEKYELAAYGIGYYRLREDLLLEAGARFDYIFMDVFKFYRTSFWESRNYGELFSEIIVTTSGNQILTNPKPEFFNLSATAGATYAIGDDYEIFFNYSLASRAPNPSELFSEGLHHSASRIELGDLDFSTEISHKFSLTIEHESRRLGFAVTPYVNTISDFIIIEPTHIQQTIRGNFQVWEYRQTNAQFLGIDLDASYAFTGRLGLNHQFSLVKGYDRTSDAPLINMPPVSTRNELVYNHPGLKNLQLALQSQYVFRQNEYPNNNFEVFIPETESFETVDVSTPPDAYHLLNFRSNIDFDLGTKTTLNLGLRVTNLLNTSYRNYLNRLRFFADDLGRNIILNLKFNY